MVVKSAAFEKAVTDSRKLKAKPTNDELLEVRFFRYVISDLEPNARNKARKTAESY